MNAGSLDVLLVGDSSNEPVRRALISLLEQVPFGHLRRAPDIASGVAQSADQNEFPDLVVVCQSWPDQFSRSAIEELFARMPLARIIVSYGDWCDSDGRNRALWPAAVRVPAWAVETRIRRELAVLCGDRRPLPLTASRDETFGFDAALPDGFGAWFKKVSGTVVRSTLRAVPATVPDTFLNHAGFGQHNARLAAFGPIQVTSPDRALRDCLQELLGRWGVRVLTSVDEAGTAPRVRVWDLDPWNEHTASELRRFCASRPETSVIGLMGFPRSEDFLQMARYSASRLVPKGAACELLPDAIAAVGQQIT